MKEQRSYQRAHKSFAYLKWHRKTSHLTLFKLLFFDNDWTPNPYRASILGGNWIIDTVNTLTVTHLTKGNVAFCRNGFINFTKLLLCCLFVCFILILCIFFNFHA